ncbi:MAG: hypothetical protein Q9160_003984 [Pyrenula sp. 1 TL-2023]
MTIILNLTRACSRQSVLRPISIYRASNGVSRVAVSNCTSQCADHSHNWSSQTSLNPLLKRHYANEAATRPAKPKAHTGRAKAAKPRTSTTKASTGTAKPKKKAAKKSTTKRKPAKKSKRKTKAKAKPKAKPKRKPTEEQKAKAAQRKLAAEKKELQKDALIGAEPKSKATSYYQILIQEGAKKGVPVAENAKNASARSKALSPEEKQRYERIAAQNSEENKANLRKWLQTLSPDQIRLANRARNTLRRLYKEKSAKAYVKSPAILTDERLVKRQANSYNLFWRERYASGDFSGMTVPEASKLAGQEWRDMSDAQKQLYKDRASGDMARYRTEYKTVYGHDVPVKKAKAATAA